LIFTPVTILLLCGEQIIPTRAKSIRNIQVPSSVLGRNRCFGLWLFIKLWQPWLSLGEGGLNAPMGLAVVSINVGIIPGLRDSGNALG